MLPVISMARGFLLAPLDALYGLYKGFIYIKGKSESIDFDQEGNLEYKANFEENQEDSASYAVGLSRIGTVIGTTLCILGFIGTLIVPFPGITFLYSVTFLGVLKAIGITAVWSIVSRGVGVFAGTFFDFGFELTQEQSNKSTYNIFKEVLGRAIKITLFGEGADIKKPDVETSLFRPDLDLTDSFFEKYQSRPREPSSFSDSDVLSERGSFFRASKESKRDSSSSAENMSPR